MTIRMTRLFQRMRPHLPAITLCIVLLVSAYLRLYRISEYMTFLGDEGRDMLVVKRMIVDHKFTLLGPTASVGGFFLGPVYYYFMLPFVWISGMNPAGAAVMVALFGIATVYLLYRFGRDLWGEWAGLTAAALYGVSPVAIAYARSSWNPNLVPFFSTLLIMLLWRSVVKNERSLVFWVGVVLGIGIQLHYLFLFLFPVAGLWFLLYGRGVSWIRYYLLGGAGFVVGYSPFLAFEVRHGFPNTVSIFRFLREGQGTGFLESTFVRNITDVPYRLFGRLVFRLPPPEQWVQVSPVFQFLWSAVIWGTIGGSIAYLAWNVFSRRSTSEKRSAVLFLLWLLVPVSLFGVYKKGIYDYYFGLFFTLPFFLIAALLRRVLVGKVWKVIGVIAVMWLLYANWQGRPFLFPPNNQLGQARMIATEAYAKTGGKPYNFALLANFNSDHVYRYFFETWGNPPVTIENTDVDPERKTVTDQLIVICELPECKPLGHPLWEIAGFGRAEIAGEWQVSFVKVMRLIHFQEGKNP